MRQMAVWALALMGVLGFAGCAFAPEQLAEQEIIRRAPDFIGPADEYQADVQGLTATRAERVILTGLRVRPTPGLVVDSLTLNLRSVRFQQRPFRVLDVAQSTFTARITDTAVNEYLRVQGRTGNELFRDVRVAFAPNEVRASGTVLVLGLPVSITTAGALQLETAQVHYNPQRLVVGGLQVPEWALPQLAALVNPIIDLRGLRFAPLLEHLTLVNGEVQLAGRADLRDLLATLR